MNSDLRLAWCDHDAAKYAVCNWHYSKSMPMPPLLKIGVWESSTFIGCVLYSRGANANIGKPYGLASTEVCELTRVALRRHKTPVSRILAVSIRFVRKHCPGIKLLVSYADPNRNHHGGIYQASNWTYVGVTARGIKHKDAKGRIWHRRQVSRSGVSQEYGVKRVGVKKSYCQQIQLLGKHKYLYALSDDMLRQVTKLCKPYPRRATSIDNDAVACQAAEGGANPTVALQSISSGEAASHGR